MPLGSLPFSASVPALLGFESPELPRPFDDVESEERPDQHIVVEAIELNLPTTVGIPLSLIVNELLTNAIKHGRGRITVKLGSSATGHALSVSNDGAGLPEAFDPVASKGLGMTLVSSLVAQIGGTLKIDRGDNNDGTRFTVLFA